MKRNLVIFALLFVCMAIGAQTVFKNEEVEVSLLKEKTWVFSTWDYTTMYLIEGEDKAVLIDTGTRCADLDKIVGQITGKPLEVIVTHMHPDHAGCIKYFDKYGCIGPIRCWCPSMRRIIKENSSIWKKDKCSTWVDASWKWHGCPGIRPARWYSWTRQTETVIRVMRSARVKYGCSVCRCLPSPLSMSRVAVWKAHEGRAHQGYLVRTLSLSEIFFAAGLYSDDDTYFPQADEWRPGRFGTLFQLFHQDASHCEEVGRRPGDDCI